MKKREDQAEIVKRFLINPKNKSAFTNCFNLTYLKTKKNLIYKMKIGYRLSSSGLSGSDLADELTYDILGHFFRSDKGLYYQIFEYFENKNITEFENHDANELYSYYLALLLNSIKQTLSKLLKDDDPQIANLKKSIYNHLEGPDFDYKELHNKIKYYYLALYKNNLRIEMLTIDELMLREIVQNAFNDSKNRREWCLEIFHQLNTFDEYQNVLTYFNIIVHMIIVLREFIDYNAMCEIGTMSIKSAEFQQVGNTAIEKTITFIETTDIRRFVEKGRISKNEAEAISRGFRNMLEDLVSKGEKDSYRTYLHLGFKHEIELEEYQKRYNFVVNTVFNNGLDYFGNYLDENSTI